MDMDKTLENLLDAVADAFDSADLKETFPELYRDMVNFNLSRIDMFLPVVDYAKERVADWPQSRRNSRGNLFLRVLIAHREDLDKPFLGGRKVVNDL
jgi:hypothetical protein